MSVIVRRVRIVGEVSVRVSEQGDKPMNEKQRVQFARDGGRSAINDLGMPQCRHSGQYGARSNGCRVYRVATEHRSACHEGSSAAAFQEAAHWLADRIIRATPATR